MIDGEPFEIRSLRGAWQERLSVMINPALELPVGDVRVGVGRGSTPKGWLARSSSIGRGWHRRYNNQADQIVGRCASAYADYLADQEDALIACISSLPLCGGLSNLQCGQFVV